MVTEIRLLLSQEMTETERKRERERERRRKRERESNKSNVKATMSRSNICLVIVSENARDKTDMMHRTHVCVMSMSFAGSYFIRVYGKGACMETCEA